MINEAELATLAPAGVRTFWRIAERWGLSVQEAAVLLGMDETQAARVRAGDLAAATTDTLVRIGHLLGIYKALHMLLPADQADGWVRRPNIGEPFAGAPALDTMLRGRLDDLVVVRGYLDGELHR